MRDKRILFISDPHVGLKSGLTPPSMWPMNDDHKFEKFQRESYHNFTDILKRNAPYDVVVLPGDIIDGQGLKSGGTELISTDRNVQVEGAVEVINDVRQYCAPKCKWFAVFGTGYHVGKEEDWETTLVNHKDMPEIDISGHCWIDVNGYTFDVKHKVGRSAVPYGRATPLNRAAVWNELWAVDGLQPRANATVRGHVHYFSYAGDRRRFNVTLPCLCWGSRFGIRECEEMIDWGLVWCDVDSKGKASWDWDIRFAETQKAYAVKV